MISLKSKDEIEKIRKAGSLVKKVLENMEEAIRPGISTLELELLAREVIENAGGSAPCIGYGDPPFPAATCISTDEVVVHGIPSANQVLAEGQIVTFDVVCELDGWMADAARTFPVGRISEEKQALSDTAKSAFYAGLEQAVPGNHIADISAAVQKEAEGKGYSVIRELTGHGIGRSMHESPDVPNYVTRRRGPRLQEGMVICIEPMIACGERYIVLGNDGWTVSMRDKRPAAHYENTIVITADGPEILTV